MSVSISDLLDLEINSIEREIRVNFEEQDLPEFLYHYTNTDGLMGILSSDTMWCSDASYLNDMSELTYSSEIAKTVINHKKEVLNDEIFYKILDNIFSFDKGIYDVYILCFSEVKDLLSQWRAYGSGGNGYAIGLNTKDLANSIWLRKVEYSFEKLIGLINKVIDGYFKLYKKIKELTENFEEKFIQKISVSLSVILVDIIIWFKHPAFMEEREWRAIFVTTPKNIDYNSLEFRSSCGHLIPYVKLSKISEEGKILKLPINEIMHGPTLNQELSRKSLELLIKKYQYDNVMINGSFVPLRLG